ncbi:twin-arginine translocase TatA/TatE family subunit [Aurantiacibacter sediminis]|uniref:Sec-independent protein translocase protein TatA n=1 Tax=Aurantiacibacter sediminis TaxID=2793064 RepID=A0ABS0N6C4_9SPHN|nr:twin-arginine translocase TatA/TatE family subunit [Aurantiacibacter sediminis]MBH5323333.1 twin-arginine translocase TatA/TatE family subunit [Aurantiacibacter sediminis]
MQPGIWQILIVAIVVLVLFGRGRISEMMGDFGKGISSFKKGMTEETRASSENSPQIEAPAEDAPAASETPETQSRNDKTAG